MGAVSASRIMYLLLCIACILRVPVLAAETLIEDDRGVGVKVPDRVGRVAAISTFAADTLMALGVTPVAASSFGDERLPYFLGPGISESAALGARSKTNLEVLSRARPELILAIRRYTEPYARHYERLAPYLAFNAITYADSLRAVARISAALGQAAAGERLNREFEAEIERYRDQAPGEVSAALLVSSGETPFAYYDHFLPAHLLHRLRAVNVIGPHPTGDTQSLGYRISLEKLLELDPDVLFVFSSKQRQAYLGNPIWRYLKAVRNGRVYEVGQHWKEGAGPIARSYILQEMAHRLYPDTFEAPQIPASIRSRPLGQALGQTRGEG